MNIGNKGVVLITGANAGVGLATTTYLAESGYKVYGTYHQNSNTAELDQAIEKGNGLIEKILMDVTREDSVHTTLVNLLLRTRRLDVVINNAQNTLAGTVETCRIQEQKQVFDTNFFGVVNVVQAILPHFRVENRGQIINIGSVAGIAPLAALEIYSASIYALKGLTESMAVTLAPFNIKVSIIEPNYITTPVSGTRNLGADHPYANFDNFTYGSLASEIDLNDFAKFIHTVMLERKPKLCYPFGEYASQLAASKFKDPSGSMQVDDQIEVLTQRSQLAHVSQRPTFERIKQAIYREIDMLISESEMENQELIGMCCKIDWNTYAATYNTARIETDTSLQLFKESINNIPEDRKLEGADNYGWSALGKAALCGNLNIMHYLITRSSKAHLNTTSKYRETPLYSVMQLTDTSSHLAFPAAKLLISSGANINLAKIHFKNLLVTPLWSAAMKQAYNAEVINLLILNGGVVYVGTLDIKVRTSINASLTLLYERFRVLLSGMYDENSSFHVFSKDIIKEITVKPYKL